MPLLRAATFQAPWPAALAGRRRDSRRRCCPAVAVVACGVRRRGRRPSSLVVVLGRVLAGIAVSVRRCRGACRRRRPSVFAASARRAVVVHICCFSSWCLVRRGRTRRHDRVPPWTRPPPAASPRCCRGTLPVAARGTAGGAASPNAAVVDRLLDLKGLMAVKSDGLVESTEVGS